MLKKFVNFLITASEVNVQKQDTIAPIIFHAFLIFSQASQNLIKNALILANLLKFYISNQRKKKNFKTTKPKY